MESCFISHFKLKLGQKRMKKRELKCSWVDLTMWQSFVFSVVTVTEKVLPGTRCLSFFEHPDHVSSIRQSTNRFGQFIKDHFIGMGRNSSFFCVFVDVCACGHFKNQTKWQNIKNVTNKRNGEASLTENENSLPLCTWSVCTIKDYIQASMILKCTAKRCIHVFTMFWQEKLKKRHYKIYATEPRVSFSWVALVGFILISNLWTFIVWF